MAARCRADPTGNLPNEARKVLGRVARRRTGTTIVSRRGDRDEGRDAARRPIAVSRRDRRLTEATTVRWDRRIGEEVPETAIASRCLADPAELVDAVGMVGCLAVGAAEMAGAAGCPADLAGRVAPAE
jgi:hypothetical protein